MRTRVKVESQVESFVKSLAPEPRCRLTIAIKAVGENRGDLKRLEGKLEGYSRLRVPGHRVIFNERAAKGLRIVDCIFAEKRGVVYEMMFNRVRDGRVVETWAMTDGDGFYEQLAGHRAPEGLDNLA